MGNVVQADPDQGSAARADGALEDEGEEDSSSWECSREGVDEEAKGVLRGEGGWRTTEADVTMADMNLSDINKWWHRAWEKERVRMSNKPTPIKNDRFAVPTNFSHFAPERQHAKKVHATHHR